MAWFEGPQCGFPDWMKFAMMMYMFSMIFLFSHFFIQRYMTGKVVDKITITNFTEEQEEDNKNKKDV